MRNIRQERVSRFIDRGDVERAQRCRGGENHDQPVCNATDDVGRIGFDASPQQARSDTDPIAESIQADDAKQPFHQMPHAPGDAQTDQQENHHGQDIGKNGEDAFPESSDWSE